MEMVKVTKIRMEKFLSQRWKNDTHYCHKSKKYDTIRLYM